MVTGDNKFVWIISSCCSTTKDTVNIMVGSDNLGTDTRTECDSLIWIDGNTYFTDINNTVSHTLTIMTGCDSLVTLDLTILPSSVGRDTRTECDSLVWIDGMTYYADNTTAQFNYANGAINGCDSLVTLGLTIIPSSVGRDTSTECNSLVWIDGNTYSENNTTAQYNIVGGAANGCDSLVTLNLTINTVDVSVTTMEPAITVDLTGASYQWLNCDGYTIIGAKILKLIRHLQMESML